MSDKDLYDKIKDGETEFDEIRSEEDAKIDEIEKKRLDERMKELE